MPELNLVLSLPQGSITATSLGIDGFAWHRSPGSGKYFQGRSIFVDLAVKDGKAGFNYLPEGDWRDAQSDTAQALDAVARGKRTKTALSNHGFSCTPVDAFQRMYLVKTAGATLEMQKGHELARFKQSVCHEGMTPEQIASSVGLPPQGARPPRIYMVMAPIEFILISSLTPEEYVWYATHRPGKVFRQVAFTELRADQAHLAAEAVFEEARREIAANANKKTKTIVSGEALNRVPYTAWIGYRAEKPGGIYVGDKDHVALWRWPETISRNWERASG